MGSGLGFSPYGVSGLRVIQSVGSGLRVSRGCGLGLRVRSPDGHVILLIPLYFNWGVFCRFFFPILSSPLPIDLLTTLLLLQLKMSAPPFAQYVDGMMGVHPILNAPAQLVGVYLCDLLASHSDRTFLRTLLVTPLSGTFPCLEEGWTLLIKRLITFNNRLLI